MKVFALADGSLIARPRSRRRRVITVVTGVAVVLLMASVILVQNRVAILSSLALTLPRILGNPIEQKIGFATTSDGVRIAYATTGEGPPLVFVLGWVTHIERGIGSPMYDSEGWIRWISKNHLYVRYDGRGFGLSDRDVEDFSLDARVGDLEAVIDALRLERFAIYAVSAGGPTAIAYTVRHPERVSRLILACTYAKFLLDPEQRQQTDLALSLYRTGWNSPSVRSMMVASLEPDLDEVAARVMSEFLRISGDGPAVAGFFQSEFELDATEMARKIEIPTLVIHGQEDSAVPLVFGRDLASVIPGAKFEIIMGANHFEATGGKKVRELVDEFLAPTLVDAE